MSNMFVISLGGSLLSSPEGPSMQFVKSFLAFIKKQTSLGRRFILITGGGSVCRQYQNALRELGVKTSKDLDWMGIHATRYNAEFIRIALGEKAHGTVITDPNKKVKFTKPVMLAAGWLPGRSSDDDAVRLAHMYGASYIVNLSNIDYHYDKDPNKHKDAIAIEKISWKDYLILVGTKWIPGAHVPFDPVASSFAQKNKLKVIVANGNNLKNLEKILTQGKSKGTVIS